MIRIGAGAGFASDRIRPARELLEAGDVDYLVLECLGERTVANAHRRTRRGAPGYGSYFEDRMRAFLGSAARHGTTIITNDGAAAPRQAGRVAADIAAEEGLSVDVTVVTGDECRDAVRSAADLDVDVDPDRVTSANVYLGAEPLIEALSSAGDGDAHVVVSGRVADPSLFVAPVVHEFGWALDDWDRLGQATVVGHLLECAGQLTGGFFMEPGRKSVAEPHRLGQPFADVEASGEAVIGKVTGTGGRIDTRTCREQLFYEVHDPSAYVTPDVTADFTNVDFDVLGDDRVRVTGGTGRERPDDLKISVGIPEGYQAECYRAYGAPNAEARARLAGEIIRRRVEDVHDLDLDLRVDIVGVDALFGSTEPEVQAPEVLLRVVAQSPQKEDVRLVYREVSGIAVNGPAAASTFYPDGRDAAIREIIGIESVFLLRGEFDPRCHRVTTEVAA